MNENRRTGLGDPPKVDLDHNHTVVARRACFGRGKYRPFLGVELRRGGT
ncbi:hypothetical protein ACFLZP_04405 [Patescibacteria group bacterium]